MRTDTKTTLERGGLITCQCDEDVGTIVHDFAEYPRPVLAIGGQCRLGREPFFTDLPTDLIESGTQ